MRSRPFRELLLNLLAWLLSITGVLRWYRRHRPYRGVKVLAYHSIIRAPFLERVLGIGMTPERFRRQARWLAENYEVLDIDAVVEIAEGRRPEPENAVAITFDDGYRDTAEQAWPILRELGLPATVFLSTAAVAGECELWADALTWWLDRSSCPRLRLELPPAAGVGSLDLPLDRQGKRQAALVLRRILKRLPDAQRRELLQRIHQALESPRGSPRSELPLMTPEDAARLAAEGMRVESHGHQHTILSRLDDEELRGDLDSSREAITRWTGRAPTHLAFPNGGPEDFDQRVCSAARELGFHAAWTFIPGVVRRGADPLRLPRYGLFEMPLARFDLELCGLLERLRRRRPQPETGPSLPSEGPSS
jgi:peptidoglycan/xylan/chitin deacetylase (PgdA/CDA1 family)